MTKTKIITNKHYRFFLYRDEVPEKVLADQFDYHIDDNGEETNDTPMYGFIYYKGYYYHLDQFMRFNYPSLDPNTPNEFKGWQAYHNDSAFSGVLIRVSDDSETYQIATYTS